MRRMLPERSVTISSIAAVAVANALLLRFANRGFLSNTKVGAMSPLARATERAISSARRGCRNSVNRLDGEAEHVACAALGPDIARLGRIGFDLAPQPADLHVDGAVEDLVVVQPRKVQQLVPSENALGRGEQDREEIEFCIAERDLTAVGRLEAADIQVELPAAEAVGANSLGPHLARLGPAAAQHGPDAREQLARAAGLGEVIVGGDLESDHAVGLVLAAGEDDDRQARLLAELARNLHPVLAGQPQVEEEEIDGLARHDLGQLAAASEGGDAKVVVGEVVGDRLPDRWIVVDREDVRRYAPLRRMRQPRIRAQVGVTGWGRGSFY